MPAAPSPKIAGTIVAVDDNADALFALQTLLERHGYQVSTASSGEEALRLVEEVRPDLVLLDVNMPGMSGYEATAAMKADEELRFIPVALLTANAELEEIVQGLERGADNYIIKPYKADELIARVRSMMRTRDLYEQLRSSERTVRELRAAIGERARFENLVGRSAPMRELFTMIEKVKDSNVPVLITGESGTGKELVARAIHQHSPRRSKPFVAQNCSAFSESLLESELFGHVRGAFTGAVRDKQGLFEAAHQGTFFLDELGEMSPALQVKLLRVLQDGTFTPVGATSPKKVNVRIVAATHRNLREMIAKGAFREDLFYRLNVINLALPPLRERGDDIALLAQHFLVSKAARDGVPPKRLSNEALRALVSYRWPGNIRELENEIERALILSSGGAEISRDDLSPIVRGGETALTAGDVAAAAVVERGALPDESPNEGPLASSLKGSLKEAIIELEQRMIQQALERSAGNKSEAARELGISRSNLIAKVKEYGIADGGGE